MTRAYSDDLRKKLLKAYVAGQGTLRALAARVDVSVAWAWKSLLGAYEDPVDGAPGSGAAWTSQPGGRVAGQAVVGRDLT